MPMPSSNKTSLLWITMQRLGAQFAHSIEENIGKGGGIIGRTAGNNLHGMKIASGKMMNRRGIMEELILVGGIHSIFIFFFIIVG